jgi:hypothetical protein
MPKKPNITSDVVVVTFHRKYYPLQRSTKKAKWFPEARVFIPEKDRSAKDAALAFVHERSQWDDYKDFEIHRLTDGQKVKKIGIEAKLEAI